MVPLLFLILACAAKEPPTRQSPAAEVPAAGDIVWNDPAGTRIGMLLPLSGSYGRFGETILDGITCAAGFYTPCPLPDRPVQIIVKDTKGDPASAALAALELIEKEQVSALLGPLLSQEVEAITQTARAREIPIIVLAPQKNETAQVGYVFQHSLIPEKEVAQIVRQSLSQGLKKFILFYPENSYGLEYKELFRRFLEKEGGGEIIAEAGYAPDLPDFTGTLRNFLEPLPASGPLGFFIPDSFRRVVKIAEGLDTLAASQLRLIGTSRWHHPLLLIHSHAALEGALIDTPFFAEGERAEAQRFQENFLKAFGSQPAWLEAIGFDAMRLILEAIRRQGKDNPSEIGNGLRTIENFAGVVGPLSWDREGISNWPLDFLTVQNGRFVLLTTP